MPHCQVCGRPIKANSGLIAHHGYQRPYQQGWQSKSCEGARYVPYEVSCDRLKEVCEGVKLFLIDQEEALKGFLANPPQTITVKERFTSWSPEKEVVYTRPEGFTVGYASRSNTYEYVFNNRKYKLEQSIKMMKSDILDMERRLKGWKPVDLSSEPEEEKPVSKPRIKKPEKPLHWYHVYIDNENRAKHPEICVMAKSHYAADDWYHRWCERDLKHWFGHDVFSIKKVKVKD